MATGPIISWQIEGEKVETVTDFICLFFLQQQACKQSQLSIYFLRRLPSLWVHSIFYHQISVRKEILPECHATQCLGEVLFFRPSVIPLRMTSCFSSPGSSFLPSLSSTVPPHHLSLRKRDVDPEVNSTSMSQMSMGYSEFS